MDPGASRIILCPEEEKKEVLGEISVTRLGNFSILASDILTKVA